MRKSTKAIGVVLSVCTMIIVLLIPNIDGLPKNAQRCLAIFTAVFILYLFETIQAAVISLAIVPLLVVLKVTDINGALSGFSSTSTYLIVGSFILAAAMEKSQLGNRITYYIIYRIGSSARRISFAIMLVNIVMAFMIPSSTARTAMLLPICLSIINQFRNAKKEKTKFGANLLLTLCITNSTISAGILTSTISNPMAIQYIADATGHTITFTQWLVWGFPPALIMTVLSWWIIQILFRPGNCTLLGGRIYVKEQLQKLGSIKTEEKKLLVILCITILLWMIGDKIGLDSTTVCLIGACLLAIPKIGFLKWKDCSSNISLSVVFICSGGISLGAAMSDTGASTWLAEKIFHYIGFQGNVAYLIIFLIIIVQFMHLVFVGTATMANVFYPILVGIAVIADINPILTVLPAAFMIGGYPVLMFFNTTPNIMCYDTGEMDAMDFPKIGVAISVAACVIYALCALWYWPHLSLY